MIKFSTFFAAFVLFMSLDSAMAQTSELCGLEIGDCVEIEIDLSGQSMGGQSVEDIVNGSGTGLQVLIAKGFDENCNMNGGFNSGECTNSILEFHFDGELFRGDFTSDGQTEYYGEATFKVGHAATESGYNNSEIQYLKIRSEAGIRYRKTLVDHTLTVLIPVIAFSEYSGRNLGVELDILVSMPKEEVPEEYKTHIDNFNTGGGGAAVVTYDYDNGLTLRTEGRFAVYGYENDFGTYINEDGYELQKKFITGASTYLFNASLMRRFFNDRLAVSLGTEYETHERSFGFRTDDPEFDTNNSRNESRSAWRTFLSGSVRIW